MADPDSAEISAELVAMARKLGALVPAAARIDRDRLMYLAGAAATLPNVAETSVTPSRRVVASWFWPLATAASLLLATTLGIALATGDAASRRLGAGERATGLVGKATPSNSASKRRGEVDRDLETSFAGYLALRRRILSEGANAPAPAPKATGERPRPAPSNRALLNQYLES